MTGRGLVLLVGGVVALASGCGRSGLSVLDESAADDDAGSSSGSDGSSSDSSSGSSGGASSGSSGSSSGGVTPTCAPAPPLVQMASGRSSLLSIALDAASVYWSDSAGVLKTSKCPGGPVLTIASGNFGAANLAVDARYVYFLENPYGYGASVMRVPIGGGPVVALAAAPFAQAMTIDATSAYWVTDTGDGTADGTVMRVPLEGGTPTTVASGQSGVMDVVVGSGNVYWTSANGKTSVGYGGQVLTVPVAGGVPAVFGDKSEGDLTMNSTSVFWEATDDYWMGSTFEAIEAIETEPIAGGTQVTMASAPHPSTAFDDLVADDSSLYYYEDHRNAGPLGIVKAPLAGGAAPTTLASTGGSAIYGIAVDDTSLYWLTDDGRVMRLTPK